MVAWGMLRSANGCVVIAAIPVEAIAKTLDGGATRRSEADDLSFTKVGHKGAHQMLTQHVVLLLHLYGTGGEEVGVALIPSTNCLCPAREERSVNEAECVAI